MNTTYTKNERIWLKDCPDFDERWVQSVIDEDPSVLKLGKPDEIVVRDRERIHKGAGRLDLLLQDIESKRRYEVEIQLGETDESHIIRTIEYWDIERKRYPQYDHCAVLIAEDITSRFLNVISLFNSSIPLIAVQMQMIKVGNQTTLVFTTVLNELSRGLVDEDEEGQAAPADRQYWENRASKGSTALVDDLLSIVQKIDPSVSLKYNKFYVGLVRGRQACNFFTVTPKKTFVRLNIKLPRSEYVDAKIEASDLETLDYNEGYRFRLTKEDIEKQESVLLELLRLAYENRLKVD
ncbi:MAG TPA: DUF5655 domain-containing protein [Candidatus Obscuribacterales bacterium]